MPSLVDPIGSVRSFLHRLATTSSEPVDLHRAPSAPAPGRWRFEDLAGRLIELAGTGAVASLSAAAALVREAQERAEPTAWIARRSELFFPPDFDEHGIDLAALVVVCAPDVGAMLRAADRLLRSGGFGLVVVDLGRLGSRAELSDASVARLAGLAHHHEAVLALIVEAPREQGSLGAMVSLRVEAARTRGSDGMVVEVRALKDKRRAPGWSEAMSVGAPPGWW